MSPSSRFDSSPLRRARALGLALAVGLAGCQQDDGLARAESTSSQPVLSAAPQNSGVRIRAARVHTGRLDARSAVSGIVRAFHKATVTAEATGRVVERPVDRGDRVEAGQLLFRLDDSRLRLDLERAGATLRARETDLAHARRELARAQKLISENAISEQRRDDLEYSVARAANAVALARVARDTAKRLLADAEIAAPFSGVVEETRVDVGDFVAAGTPTATLVELSRVRIHAGVTAAEADRLSVGMLAQARFAALGGASREARLRSVGLVADPRSGTYELEFWVDNADGRLREGMLASLELPDPDRPARPLVPRAALIRRHGEMAVFVVEGPAESFRARTRTVIVGDSKGDWTEILQGLQEGENVVVHGQFALTDGALVMVDSEADTGPVR